MVLKQGIGRLRKVAKDKKQDKKIKKLEKKVNSLVVSALRQKAQNNAAATVTNAGFMTLLNGMQTGDGDNQRNGNTVSIRRLECRCSVSLDAAALAAATAQTYHYRMMIIYDTQPNNAAPLIGDILLNSANNANNFLSVYDYNNVRSRLLGQKGRFVILFDRTWTLQPASNTRAAVGTTTYETPALNIVVKKLFKNGLITKYDNSNVGDVTDINTGSIHMYETCSNNVNLISANRCAVVYME